MISTKLFKNLREWGSAVLLAPPPLPLGKPLVLRLTYECYSESFLDTTIVSRVCSLRLLQVSLLIFTSLMTTSYNSVLVSRLTVAHNSYHISLESIPRPGIRFVCVRTNSAVFSMFQVC